LLVNSYSLGFSVTPSDSKEILFRLILQKIENNIIKN
jgi:hypothetical protein